MRHYAFFPNRTVCDVLTDMRKCNETKNYSLLGALIEEVQILANRMESGLQDKSSLEEWLEMKTKLKKEIKQLEKKKKRLK